MPLPDSGVREWRDVTPAIFRDEIMPAGQPAVLRGAVAHWPSVRAGRESPQAMAKYLLDFDARAATEIMLGDPAIGGRFFYNDDLTGVNFQRRQQPLAQSLAQLIANLDVPDPPALYVGAVPTPALLPGLALENTLDLVAPSVVPRLWLSNRVTVQAHYDLSFNVACVLAGRRRFTLFPPEQFVNLYVGPLEFTLAGQPISMVRIEDPDHERFPKFREAWRHAQYAELEPGDALFIPYMWWHHVESLSTFNVLYNYWWDDTPPWQGSAFEAMLHGLLAVRPLPPERRELWRQLFEHYVFRTAGDPVSHLTERQQGIQGPMTPKLAEVMRQHLAGMLSRRR
ncbi:MAG: cupin [Steroidobacteraceae bacterium]|jgi:hypothetical protein|nr:cupin [Steroidobacteraceae bacterium]